MVEEAVRLIQRVLELGVSLFLPLSRLLPCAEESARAYHSLGIFLAPFDRKSKIGADGFRKGNEFHVCRQNAFCLGLIDCSARPFASSSFQ